MYTFIYRYIYIHIHRDRDIHTYTFIYIYIYIPHLMAWFCALKIKGLVHANCRHIFDS